MKKQNIKYSLAFLAVLTCISIIPQKASAQSLYSFTIVQPNTRTLRSYYNSDNGTGVFNQENFKYLSSEQQKQLKEYQNCKDMGKKLSEEQQKNLDSIVDCVIKGRLGDEKYKDFKSLMSKKQAGTKLTSTESKNLKEYKKIMNNCDDCSNSEILKQFLR